MRIEINRQVWPIEEWRIVPGWDAYEVSNIGHVRRTKLCSGVTTLGQNRKFCVDAYGYPSVALSQNNKQKTMKIHRLVCEVFNGPAPSAQHEVAHGDGIRTNNFFFNLRWATREENQNDRWSHGTAAAGERHGMSKLTLDDAIEIKTADYSKRGSIRKMASKMGVRPAQISRIINGERWGAALAHIGDQGEKLERPAYQKRKTTGQAMLPGLGQI